MIGTVIGNECERLDRPDDRDGTGRDDHLVDEPAGIALPHVAVRRAQLGQDHLAEPLDSLGRDPAIAGRELALDQQNFGFEVGAAAALGGEASGEVGVARANNALLDEVEHVLDRTLDPRPLGAQRLQLRLSLADGGGTVVEQVGKQVAQPLRTEQPLGERVDHDPLQRLIAHAGAGTRGLAAAQAARAAVIAIATTLAGGDGQRVAALGIEIDWPELGFTGGRGIGALLTDAGFFLPTPNAQPPMSGHRPVFLPRMRRTAVRRRRTWSKTRGAQRSGFMPVARRSRSRMRSKPRGTARRTKARRGGSKAMQSASPMRKLG